MIGAIAFAFTSFLVVPAASAATTAGAQTCDPAYGCTPTTPPPGSPASCNVVPASAGPDVVVTVRLTNVGLDVPVNLTFDGKVINGGLTTADGKGTTSSALPVVTAAAGKHPLLLVGAGILCDPTAGAQFEVLPPAGRLGISQTATGGIELSFKLAAATAATPPGSGGSGSLARTGMQIALFLAAALVALVIGWSLVQAARRRRRRVEQARNEVRDLSHH